MSQWAPDSENLTRAPESRVQESTESETSQLSIEPEDESSKGSAEGLSRGPKQPTQPTRMSGWMSLTPFFLSALFFLSGFLVIIAPLNLMVQSVRKGRLWAYLAALTNSAMVAFFGGWLVLLFFLIGAVTPALVLPELLNRKKSMEVSVAATLLAMVLAAGLFILGYAQVYHLSPIQVVQLPVLGLMSQLRQIAAENPSFLGPLSSPGDLDEEMRRGLTELPAVIAIFSLFMVWTNLVLLLKSNPRGLREKLGWDISVLKHWKTPLFLVWPVVVSGFFLVVDVPIVSEISLNLFKFLMSIYAIQGLSILIYFFDLWGFRGFFRFPVLMVSLLLMTPLVVGLGFFDLWFDFRAKFRQP